MNRSQILGLVATVVLPISTYAEDFSVFEGYADIQEIRDAEIPDAGSSEIQVRVKFHVVRAARFGTGGDLESANLDSRLDGLVDQLNSIYAPAAIRFLRQPTAMVDLEPENERLNEVDSSEEKRKLMDFAITTTEASSCLNVVVVPIRNLGFDGHAHFPWSRASLRKGSGVMMSDQYVFPGLIDGEAGRVDPQVLAHEIGHALGLWHLERGVKLEPEGEGHEIGGLSESQQDRLSQLVSKESGLKGNARGDFCKDTAPIPSYGELELIYRLADPDQDGITDVEYLRPEVPLFDWLASDVGNLMRASGDRRYISSQQAGRMRAWLKTRLSSWIEGESGGPERLISDLEFNSNDGFSPGVRLLWIGPVGGAYAVERSTTPDFASTPNVDSPVFVAGSPSSSVLPKRAGYAEFSLLDAEIINGVEYWYRVVGSGKSTYSRRMSIRAAGSRTGAARPATTPRVKEHQVRSVPGGVLVEWEDPDDIDVTGYEIRRWKEGTELDPPVLVASVAAGTSKFASYFDDDEQGNPKDDDEEFIYQVVAYFGQEIGDRIYSGNTDDGAEQGTGHQYSETPMPSPAVLSYIKIPTVGLSYTGTIGVDFPGIVPTPISGDENETVEAIIKLFKDEQVAEVYTVSVDLTPGERPRIVDILSLDTGSNYHCTLELVEDVSLEGGGTIPRSHGVSIPHTLRIPGKIIYAPAVVAPPSGTVQPSYPSFSWKPVLDADEYVITLVRIVGDPRQNESREIVVPGTQLTYTLGVNDLELHALSEYGWSVAGHNDEGFGPGSAERTFSTGLRGVRLISPAEVEIVSAPRGVIAYQPHFQWDGMPGEVSYRLRIWDSAGTRVLNRQTDNNFNQESEEAGLLSYGDYTWQVTTFVRGGDPNTLPFEKSMLGNFTIRTVPKNKPRLISPPDTHMNLSTLPFFQWDGTAQATAYDLQIVRVNPNGVAQTPDNFFGLPGTTYFIPEDRRLKEGRLHYWRVRARNELGSGPWTAAAADYSDWWEFGTKLNKPQLTSPLDGSTVSSRHPTLSWSIESGATAYDVEIYDGSTLAGSASVGSNPSWNIPEAEQLSATKTYTWKVRATGPANNPTVSQWSDPFTFTIRTVPNNKPKLISPPDTHVNLATLPFFQWNAPAQATAYDLQIVRVNPNGVAQTPDNFFGLSETTYFIPEDRRLKGDRLHYWRVRGLNELGSGPWTASAADYSDWWEFRTKLNKPQLVSPVNGKPDEPRTPTFTWNESPGAQNYLFEIWKLDPSTGAYSLLTNKTATTGTTSLQIFGRISNSASFRWRITANGPTQSKGSNYFTFSTAP